MAEQVAAELTGAGAIGVALTGSVALGVDRPNSDVDLVVLAAGEPPRGGGLRAVEGRLVSVAWHTVDEVRESFGHPADVGAVVPGWRTAVALADPHGAVAELRAAALAWTWAPIAVRADAWVADTVTGLAEEAGKVAGLAAAGSARAAAVNRAVLALQLGRPLAVHHRLLYGTENRLWDELAEREGPKWTADLDAALGVRAVPADAAARAAVRLYARSAARVRRQLSPGQRAVVDAVVGPISAAMDDAAADPDLS